MQSTKQKARAPNNILPTSKDCCPTTQNTNYVQGSSAPAMKTLHECSLKSSRVLSSRAGVPSLPLPPPRTVAYFVPRDKIYGKYYTNDYFTSIVDTIALNSIIGSSLVFPNATFVGNYQLLSLPGLGTYYLLRCQHDQLCPPSPPPPSIANATASTWDVFSSGSYTT